MDRGREVTTDSSTTAIVIAIVIAIGNSDGRLSQAEWSAFYEDTDALVRHFGQFAGITIHGRWVSPSTDRWQNAGWSLAAADAALPQTRELQWELQRVLAMFDQQSLAWTVGQTRLLPPTDSGTLGRRCTACRGLIHFVDSPTGGWWAHVVHPSDHHDAETPEETA